LDPQVLRAHKVHREVSVPKVPEVHKVLQAHKVEREQQEQQVV
jgi:hypothetical protein